MTSGSFSLIDPRSIIVNRELRQRREIDDIESLAESILSIGLIHPLVIDRGHVLISGERRLTAILSLGLTSVPVQWADDLSSDERELIELDENVRRKNLTWDEECAAIARYHALRVSQEPTHSIESTAKELGMSEASASDRILVAKAIPKSNLVANAGKYSTALNIVRRERSRAETALKNTIHLDGEAPSAPIIPLLNEDFHEWAQAYTGQRFNLIHCDFPYGVGMHKSGQGSNAEYGSYADGKDVYFDLLKTLDQAMENVVAESAHLVFWFSMDYYEFTKNRLEGMGWRVNPFPFIWYKSDNTGVIPDAQRGPRRVYETAFFASRGDRLLSPSGPRANVFACGGKDKSIHMNEKPVAMLQHFLSMIVDEYSFVLDPTAGSANALKAASALGAGKVLGLEKDPEFFARASEAYFEF